MDDFMSENEATAGLSPLVASALSGVTFGLITGLLSFCCCVLGINGVLTVIGTKRLAGDLPAYGTTLVGVFISGIVSGSLSWVVQITSALYVRKQKSSMPISETEQQLVDTILSRTLDNWTATYLQATFASTLFALIGGSIVWLWLWNSSRPPTTK